MEETKEIDHVSRKTEKWHQIFRDKDDRPWRRYSIPAGITGPSYTVPFVGKDLRTEIFSHYEPGRYASACLPIPYYSWAMWPAYPDAIRSVWSYTYYFCPLCDRPIHETKPVYHMAIQFIVGYLQNGRESLTWVVRILCGDCSPKYADVSTYPFMLFARSDLSKVLSETMKQFDDRLDHTKCYVCEAGLPKARQKMGSFPICNNELCTDSLKLMNEMNADPNYTDYADSLMNVNPRDRIRNVVEHCRKHRIDICTPLRWSVCHALGCDNKAKSNIFCNQCRRVAYCSKWCQQDSLENHKDGCKHFCDVWNAENLLFM